jgi:uncharacterized protein YbcI
MPDAETPSAPGLPVEISGLLASVWKQYAGERPSDTQTEVRDNRVRCVHKDAVRSFDEGMAAGETEDGADGTRRTQFAYRNDAIAAVRRATGRRVVALVSDRDTETDVATEVFLLESRSYRR